jgi:hypothetical protein
MMNATFGEVFDLLDVEPSERAMVATRSDLRSDLVPCKTLRGWANRANRSESPIVLTEDLIEDIAAANRLEIALNVTGYARSTYTNDGSKTEGAGRVFGGVRGGKVVSRTVDRKNTQTELSVTEKASEACPTEGCEGYLHPVNMRCNGGHFQAGRCCGTYQPTGGEQVIRTDRVDRYEQVAKGMPTVDFDAETITLRTIKQRGGADKAGVNPEKWQISARWISGGKPFWVTFRFGLVIIEDPEGNRGFMTVAYPAHQEAQAIEAGITIRGDGCNLFNREAAL